MTAETPSLSPIPLTPAQNTAVEALHRALDRGNCFVLWSADGLGRTTVLREFHRRAGGARLTMRDFVEAASNGHPLALEEAMYRIIREALAVNDVVSIDDMHLLHGVFAGCHSYPRTNYFSVPLMSAVTYAREAGKRLIFGAQSYAPSPLHERAIYVPIEQFTIEDYAFLCRTFLGDAEASQLNYSLVLTAT